MTRERALDGVDDGHVAEVAFDHRLQHGQHRIVRSGDCEHARCYGHVRCYGSVFVVCLARHTATAVPQNLGPAALR